jgi:hypothetical protein
MPIPQSHLQEELSKAYVAAVVASAGARVTFSAGQEYGTDAHVLRVQQTTDGRFVDTGYILQCQLKSSVRWSEDSGYIVYDMEAEAYNRLIDREGGGCILVLLCLPQKVEEWLSVTVDELVMRKSCYWLYLEGERTENSGSKRVKIPESQRFVPDTVETLLDMVRQGRFTR